MAPDLRTLLGEHHDTFQHVVIDALQQAYSSTLESHRPEHGHNAQTFGFLVWHSSVHYLQEMLASHLGSATIERPDQSLRIQLGEAAFYVSKAGNRHDDDIHQFRFDQSAIRTRIATENRTLQLFDYTSVGEVVDPVAPPVWNVMIAHCGNWRDGMCKVVIGPIRPATKNTSPWINYEVVYTKSSGLAPVEDAHQADVDQWLEKPVGDLNIGRKIFVPRVATSKVEAVDVS